MNRYNGEEADMFSSEEEKKKDELLNKTQGRRKDVASPPSLPSNEGRSEATLTPAEERRELRLNKEAGDADEQGVGRGG